MSFDIAAGRAMAVGYRRRRLMRVWRSSRPINRSTYYLPTSTSPRTRLSGLDLAQEAVRHCPNLRALYTSGQGLTDGMKALVVDGSDFLAKPYDLDHLAAKVGDTTTQKRN
jgi:hypothetical protein